MYTHTCVHASVSCECLISNVCIHMPLVYLGRRVSTSFQKRLFTLPDPTSDFSYGSFILGYEQGRISYNNCKGIHNIDISLDDIGHEL